jgi:5-methylcytosine-specific restriction endonuclease McrA
MRAILLDATYEPLGIISWKKAFFKVFDILDEHGKSIFNPKAEVLYAYPNKKIRSQREQWDWPAIIILKKPSNRRTARRLVNPSTRSILVRDLYTCQYCGKKLSNKTGTKDHVIPESQGGLNTWNNLVAACHTCQQKKDNHMPEDVHMWPKSKPRAPTLEERFWSGIRIANDFKKKTWTIGLKKLGLDYLLKKPESLNE